MPAIRLPQSAEPLLKFCRRHEEAEDNACFETYADLVVFAASCGYYRLDGLLPSEAKSFLAGVYPIDIGVFKNQGLFPNLLLMGLGATGEAEISRDEEALCQLTESFANVGFQHLSCVVVEATFARCHITLASLILASNSCQI
jgi:hypothetical protein